jgi:hypothetical protein
LPASYPAAGELDCHAAEQVLGDEGETHAKADLDDVGLAKESASASARQGIGFPEYSAVFGYRRSIRGPPADGLLYASAVLETFPVESSRLAFTKLTPPCRTHCLLPPILVFTILQDVRDPDPKRAHGCTFR